MPHRSTSQHRRRPRLLVVDDEAPQQRALCEILIDQGYDVVGCTDPLVALDKLDQSPFELLLTDLQMPGIDGIELTRRAQAVAPDMVVVLMTAHGSIGSVVDAMKNGAIDYVQKPFRISGIVPAVERALEVQRLRVNNRRLEAEVSQQVKELVAVNQELDAFAARLAHDLRGPLVNMRSILATTLQDSGTQLDREQAELLRLGVQSGDLALRMVRDLLEFARLGNQSLTMAPLQLDDVLQAALATVKPQSEGREIDWSIGPLPTLQGHAGLLQQAFANLLGNAIKYTSARAVAHISVSAQPLPDGGQAIVFSDDGAGFDPKHADQLFKPFRRLHTADEFVGEGMGLANVRRIVERHGGTVTARGRLGEGASFTIVFPPQPSA
ncbi:sensor histidine kinase [Hydrogenophaga sp. PBL-H3]|uniref:sensor histidine kinase n=1 Tax=Hydrogenophaga sp. PBL-H3 TaxID=434010 RepID=UPI0013203B1B|nr:response regulator [Hydrogenophaga sp. PBL-H3]QHE78030.1 response regulator [Hydrogenophaga sp. PBL-H3]QHE82454.1 response regulator [Hydrogenophaga sp. PBL-H3]